MCNPQLILLIMDVRIITSVQVEMSKAKKLYFVMYCRSTLRLLLVCKNYDDKDLISVSVRCYVQENRCAKYNAIEEAMKRE
jgi:hypothetical protein